MRSVFSCVAVLALAAAPAVFAEPRSAGANRITPEAQAMAKAFPASGAYPQDVANVQLLAARNIVAQSLGDDARDLVFIPITPCTVWDTRFATDPNSAGLIASGQTKRFYSYFFGAGGSFANWGGNPSCPETAENSIGLQPYAVMMTVYINDATANGWLTLYRDGDPDPSQATISVYYSPGATRTQTVISKSSRGYGTGTYDIAATSRFASTHASASVTGYFLKPVNITLAQSTATTGNILKGATRFIHNFGANNTFIGVNAGNFTMTGEENTASGAGALSSNTEGDDNTANGWNALLSNTTGSFNTASGAAALRDNTTGFANTATGAQALFANTIGNFNTGHGSETLRNNTTGSFNTASGLQPLYSNTTGSNNTASGFHALQNNTTGNSNIAIGSAAGTNLTTGNFNISIGNPGVAAEGNTIRIGDGNQTRAFIAGIRGVATGVANAITVGIDSNGQLGTASSSRRFKDEIADMDAASSALMNLRPVTFHYKTDPEHTLQYGLVAEEVTQVYPGLVAHSADGEVETVMYQFLPPMLLNEYQKQQRTIESLNARIAALEKRSAEQAAHLAKVLDRLR